MRPDPVQVLQASLTAVQVRKAPMAWRSTVAVSVDSRGVRESSRSKSKRLTGQGICMALDRASPSETVKAASVGLCSLYTCQRSRCSSPVRS